MCPSPSIPPCLSDYIGRCHSSLAPAWAQEFSFCETILQGLCGNIFKTPRKVRWLCSMEWGCSPEALRISVKCLPTSQLHSTAVLECHQDALQREELQNRRLPVSRAGGSAGKWQWHGQQQRIWSLSIEFYVSSLSTKAQRWSPGSARVLLQKL